MDTIKDIWIMLDSGIVLVEKISNANIKTQLFGALMSALNLFAEEVSEGGLNNFEIGGHKITIMKKNHILFVTNTPKNMKERLILAQLKGISDKFFELYPTEWFQKEWNSDLSKFEEFEKVIDKLLDERMSTFWTGI